jgi:hypothetical protein
MKLVGIISLFTGWFGAGIVYGSLGGYLGAGAGVALFLCVTAAHDHIFRGKSDYEEIYRWLGLRR